MNETQAHVALSVFGLTHRFGAREALREVSFELERGSILALAGPNGSGKSTLLKIAAGIVPFGEGVIRVGASILSDLSSADRASRVTYVGSELRAEFPLTAQEAVALGAVSRRTAEDDRVQWAMDACGCWGLRARLLSTLSGGERQLVALARGLVQGGKVLLLDESLSKMDLHHQSRVGALLRSLAADRGYAVILVAHDLNLACEWADSAMLLDRGSITASGKVDQTVTAANLSRLYPGASLTVGKSPASGAVKVFFGANPVT